MNARSEMKERHELEEFLKAKKTDTVSLFEDEKTCPLSPNEEQEKNIGEHFVTHEVRAVSMDSTNNNTRIKMKEDDFRSGRKSVVGGFAAERARMKSEGEGVKGRRHTSLPSHKLTFDQRLKIKMDEGETKLYSNKSESSVRSSHRDRRGVKWKEDRKS